MDEVHVMKKLSRLKLLGIAETLEHRLEQAVIEKWSYSMLLDMLLTDEVERRNHRQLGLRLAKSHLDQRKTMETFKFEFNPTVQAPLIRELSLCAFVEKKQNVFILGQSGVGKSHLAQALGHEACRREWDVLCYGTYQLLEWLQSGRGDGTQKRRLAQVVKAPLLILDDFGLQAINEAQQDDLYQLIAGRYEQSSTIITSNRDVDEWSKIFSNPLIGTAAVDRLVHKGIRIAIEGPSYRLEEYKKTCKENRKTATIEKSE